MSACFFRPREWPHALRNPPYFPQSNGGVEVDIRDFKRAIGQRQPSPATVPMDLALAVEVTARHLAADGNSNSEPPI